MSRNVTSSGISGELKRPNAHSSTSLPNIIKPKQKVERDASTKLDVGCPIRTITHREHPPYPGTTLPTKPLN